MIFLLREIFKRFIQYGLILFTGGRIKSYVPCSTKLGQGVIVGWKVEISRCCRFIGRHTFIHSDVKIEPSVEEIGEFCSISRGVKIGLGAHPKNRMSTSPLFYDRSRGFVKTTDYHDELQKSKTIIGNDVLISAGVCILAGVKVNTGAIIGAGAVVVDDVPPYAIVVGVPAKVIGYRFSQNVINELLASKWWTYSLQDIYKQYKHFGERG